MARTVIGEPGSGAPFEPELEAPFPERLHWDWYVPVLIFAAIAGAVVLISILAHAHLPLLHHHHRQVQGAGWVGAFSWWDGWWYTGIARRGYYTFHRGRQSPIAFFPLYPLMIRHVAKVTGGAFRAGFLLSLSSGLGATVLFHRWCVERMGSARARLAVLFLLLYPFAFYLMGAIYADALFLLFAIAAFLALEHDRPVLAGIAGGLATASRPVGIALVLGLWVLSLERKGCVGVIRSGGWRALRSHLRPADLGLLLAPPGLVAYCVFLWTHFGRPVAFLDTAGSRGWDQPPGIRTWLKVRWFTTMWHGPWTDATSGTSRSTPWPRS